MGGVEEGHRMIADAPRKLSNFATKQVTHLGGALLAEGLAVKNLHGYSAYCSMCRWEPLLLRSESQSLSGGSLTGIELITVVAYLRHDFESLNSSRRTYNYPKNE
jgi:hypothetical protein